MWTANCYIFVTLKIIQGTWIFLLVRIAQFILLVFQYNSSIPSNYQQILSVTLCYWQVSHEGIQFIQNQDEFLVPKRRPCPINQFCHFLVLFQKCPHNIRNVNITSSTLQASYIRFCLPERKVLYYLTTKLECFWVFMIGHAHDFLRMVLDCGICI